MMRWGRVGPAATAAYITPTSATPGHIYPSYRGREVGDGGVWEFTKVDFFTRI